MLRRRGSTSVRSTVELFASTSWRKFVCLLQNENMISCESLQMFKITEQVEALINLANVTIYINCLILSYLC